MKDKKPKLSTPHEPSKERSTIDQIMCRPLENHFERRAEDGFYIPHLRMNRGTMEVALDPQGQMAKLQEEMCTPKGNDNAINGMINKWITQRIGLDQLYEAKILEQAPCDSNLYEIDTWFQRKHENENKILKMFAAKKKLLSLPGFSFTQVNHSNGPQQINNGPVNNGSNGNEKTRGEI